MHGYFLAFYARCKPHGRSLTNEEVVVSSTSVREQLRRAVPVQCLAGEAGLRGVPPEHSRPAASGGVVAVGVHVTPRLRVTKQSGSSFTRGHFLSIQLKQEQGYYCYFSLAATGEAEAWFVPYGCSTAS